MRSFARIFRPVISVLIAMFMPFAITGPAQANTPSVAPVSTDAPFASSFQSRATPMGSPGDWVSNSDYPPSAIRAGQEGTTGFRLEIGSDGLVKNCVVTVPSGNADLDSTTCRLVAQRARFTPAKDAAGMPVSDTYSSRIRWVMPKQNLASVFPFPLQGSIFHLDFEVDIDPDGNAEGCRMLAKQGLPEQMAKTDFCDMVKSGRMTAYPLTPDQKAKKIRRTAKVKILLELKDLN